MVMVIAIGVVLAITAWFFRAAVLKSPAGKICGSPGGPPVTSPRIQLKDGRHVAYKEMGVPKEEARYKVIIIHGFNNSKDMDVPFSQELIKELGIYFLLFDRPGYGESDPNPNISVKNEAFDLQEIADKLQIGSKFHVMGLSMGARTVWSCLKYIPHRLAGAAVMLPIINYNWPSLPADLANETFKLLPEEHRWTIRIAYFTPWLFNWWMSQKWFPHLNATEPNMAMLTHTDLEIIKNLADQTPSSRADSSKQGVEVSVYRDLLGAYGKWEFDPMDIPNPFPNKERKVHLWQGDQDKFVPVKVTRFIAQKLPWIRYHEVPGAGHFMFHDRALCDGFLREILLG